MIVMDQVKILLENLQMGDPSAMFLPYKVKDRSGVESDIIVTGEHIHNNYDCMRKYSPQFYIHRYDTYMYSNVLMAFNTPLEDMRWEISNILYGKHQAMYPRDLQVEDSVIVGSLLFYIIKSNLFFVVAVVVVLVPPHFGIP
jgi:hypothetical protein